ncbi:MAG: hypothetical protein JXA78_00180 [Anaerolineales bacterium]|nr:hypothetical protein [Anaerolineales bacterium]
MVQISLPEHTVNKLRSAAEARGEKVSELLGQIIERYIEDERVKQIDREQAAFEAQHPALLEQYAGQYIAMQDGKVVDHDSDRAALGRRVRTHFGDQVVLITPVLDEARQTILVRSPRVENNP